MNTQRLAQAFTATLLGVLAQGVALGATIEGAVLELTPAMVMPGTPFVASLEGTYSQDCLLGPGVVTGSYSNDGFEIKFRTDNHATCSADSVMGTEHFGAFRLPENATSILNPDLPLKVTFIVDGVGVAEAWLDVTFDAAEMPRLALSSGVYWDAAHNGSGMSIEDLGDYLFVAAYMFDGGGNPIWRTAQGSLVGGTLDTDFLAFAGGACIICGEPGIEPTLIFDEQPAQFMVRGTGEVFLAFGNSPDRAVHLNRFDTQAMPAEERAPVLMGTWTFVDLQTGRSYREVLFDDAERIDDLTRITSSDDSIGVDCLDYGECELVLPDAREIVPRCEVMPDRILGERLIGIRTK